MSKPKPINPWNYKPWWCQPWSILLTGITIIASNWIILKNLWFSLGIDIPVLLWMAYFLLIWPQLVKSSLLLDEQPTQLADSHSNNS